MTNRMSRTALFLISGLTPSSLPADTIDFSDVRISARATFSSQRVPERSDVDIQTAPPDQLLQAAQALVMKDCLFPINRIAKIPGLPRRLGLSVAFLVSA